MESPGITERIHSKTVLITGATGFIAKLLIEKILRLQPAVKRLYLLVRANDQVSAKKRVRSEILQHQIFQSLREKYETQSNSWFWAKVSPVVGDVSLKNLGIGNVDLAEHIAKETDIIIHLAASVNFRERYDTALAINTMGVKHVIEFASSCRKLELVLLVSTAFVNVDKTGILLEKPLHQYRSYDGLSELDISEELAYAEARLKELVRSGASEDVIRNTMKKIGTERACKFGWWNTYTFTKAMGEMLAYEHLSRLPIAIVRPSAVISPWKEPLPGWVEGISTLDIWIANYAKGYMKFVVGDVTGPLDIVPADVVVNAMLCIVSRHPQRPLDFIYHVCSSTRNPIKMEEFVRVMYRYFLEKPFVNEEGDVVLAQELNVQPGMVSFYEVMDTHYKKPLQDMLRRGLPTADDQNRYNRLRREYIITMVVSESYHPVALSRARFDDSNMQYLIATMSEPEGELIPCDMKLIDMETYLMEIHIPSVVEFISREAKRARL
ncbi:hypothetical protein EJB05_28262, partial [Eragrostis curvula]